MYLSVVHSCAVGGTYKVHAKIVKHPLKASLSRHQKGKTILDFNEARDDGVAVASADYMQII